MNRHSDEEITKAAKACGNLTFLDELEQAAVLKASESVHPWIPGKRLHASVLAYKKHLAEWLAGKKRARSWEESQPYKEPIYLAEEVAPKSLDRIYRLYDSLIRALAPLGCELDEKLNFQVRGEVVSFRVKEARDTIDHVLTKEDKAALERYEEEKRRDSYWAHFASKPRIRKYDHPFNGHLSVTINGRKRFRDKENLTLEGQLPDMLIALYEESEVVRQKRLKEEEEKRQEEERKQRKLERRKRYNEEADKVEALLNAADDYAEACKIRAYVQAVRDKGNLDKAAERWLVWAEKKADWMDPLTDREDEWLGKRIHTQSREAKKLKRLDVYRWGW